METNFNSNDVLDIFESNPLSKALSALKEVKEICKEADSKSVELFGYHWIEKDTLNCIKAKCIELGVCVAEMYPVPFNCKYFLTDKDYLISRKSDYVKKLSPTEKEKYDILIEKSENAYAKYVEALHTPLADNLIIDACESDWSNVEKQINLLFKDKYQPQFRICKQQRQYKLYVPGRYVQQLKNNGYSVSPAYKDLNDRFMTKAQINLLNAEERTKYFAGYYVEISANNLIKLAKTGELTANEGRTNKHSCKSFSFTDKDGNTHSFASQKECAMEFGCSTKSLQRLLKDKVVGDSFTLKGNQYKLA